MARNPEAFPPDISRSEAANSRQALRARICLAAAGALQAVFAVLLEYALRAVLRRRTATHAVELIEDLAADHLAGRGNAAILQLRNE
jgi:hypothetical protein